MEREDFEKSLEGLSEETKSKLLKNFDEQSEELKKLQPKSEHFLNLIKERDEAKRKLKSLEDEKAKSEEEAKKKQGEFKELYEKANAKVVEFEKTIEELTPYKEKYSKVEADRRKELVEQIPEAETDVRKVAEKISSLDDLKDYVKVAIDKLGKKPVDDGRGGKGKLNIDGKTWDNFTIRERQELFVQNREAWDLLYEKKYGKKYSG